MDPVLSYSLLALVYVAVFWWATRTRITTHRLDNGNKIIVTNYGFPRRGYKIEMDYSDPQTKENMNTELKRINDWWESSKNCKHG